MKNDIYTKIARDSLEYFLKLGKVLEPPKKLPKPLLARAGVFVSLHSKGSKELRGCIGTFLPTRTNLAQEIIYNAIAAAASDPRFPPVTLEELPGIEISVDILSLPKPVSNPKTLNPKVHGLILSSADGRRGLLLPDIEEINKVEEQERICRLKAGIGPEEQVTYHCFTVKRYKEQKIRWYNYLMAKIITIPNPILRQKSKEVPLDKNTLDLVKELQKTATPKKGVKGVGISAVQIGILKRVFLAYSQNSRKFLTFINPQIVWKSKRIITGVPRPNKLEGCLSVPDIWGLVKRHQVVKIRYQTLSGQTTTRRFKGFFGVICQHEYDHLEGILFTDRVLEQKGKLYQVKKDEDGRETLEEVEL